MTGMNLAPVSESFEALGRKAMAEMRAEAGTLLAKARGQDAREVERCLIRISNLQALCLVDQPNLQRYQDEVRSVVNELELIAARYGLEGLASARLFAQRMLGLLVKAAFAAAMA